MIAASEFSRLVRIDTLGGQPQSLSLAANEAELRALADRFDLVAIDRLAADIALTRSGDEVRAAGTLSAAVRQRCVATDAEVAANIDERFEIVFRPQPSSSAGEDEVELSDAELDVIFYDGAAIDIGEAVAETLSLTLDPYPRAPDAEAALHAAGVKSEADAEVGPFAGLKDMFKP